MTKEDVLIGTLLFSRQTGGVQLAHQLPQRLPFFGAELAHQLGHPVVMRGQCLAQQCIARRGQPDQPGAPVLRVGAALAPARAFHAVEQPRHRLRRHRHSARQRPDAQALRVALEQQQHEKLRLRQPTVARQIALKRRQHRAGRRGPDQPGVQAVHIRIAVSRAERGQGVVAGQVFEFKHLVLAEM